MAKAINVDCENILPYSPQLRYSLDIHLVQSGVDPSMSLSAEQIRWGFWNWNRSRDWPPKHITHFSDYRPSERLSLNITQLDRVSYYRQTRIVDLWCSELPNLKQGGLEFIEHFLLYKMRVKYN